MHTKTNPTYVDAYLHEKNKEELRDIRTARFKNWSEESSFEIVDFSQ